MNPAGIVEGQIFLFLPVVMLGVAQIFGLSFQIGKRAQLFGIGTTRTWVLCDCPLRVGADQICRSVTWDFFVPLSAGMDMQGLSTGVKNTAIGIRHYRNEKNDCSE